MTSCRLNLFPIELIQNLFEYFSTYEIFFSFINVSSYIDTIIFNYPDYRLDLKSIRRKQFDLICQHLIPEQVISLVLVDDGDTPGLVQLFLSRFEFNRFIRLQSLTLIEIGPKYWQTIISNLNHLRILKIYPSKSYCWKPRFLMRKDKDKFEKLILTNCNVLRICSLKYIDTKQLSQLRHLIVKGEDLLTIQSILPIASQLRSLKITNISLDTSLLTELICPFITLNRLTLEFSEGAVFIDYIERILFNAPNLKHFELVADLNDKSIINGERWHDAVKNLTTFNFKFQLTFDLKPNDLDTYRTHFWIEEKCWFVAYQDQCLYSVPYFLETETDEDFEYPEFSTLVDNQLFLDRIKKFTINILLCDCKYQFNFVEDLFIPFVMPALTLRKIVSLNSIRYLTVRTVNSIIELQQLIQSLPNLCHLKIRFFENDFSEEYSCQPMINIRKLHIQNHISLKHRIIQQLAVAFPNVEHLSIETCCQGNNILQSLKKFSCLSTASFCYSDRHVLNQFLQTNSVDFHYRYDNFSIYLWI